MNAKEWRKRKREAEGKVGDNSQGFSPSSSVVYTNTNASPEDGIFRFFSSNSDFAFQEDSISQKCFKSEPNIEFAKH